MYVRVITTASDTAVVCDKQIQRMYVSRLLKITQKYVPSSIYTFDSIVYLAKTLRKCGKVKKKWLIFKREKSDKNNLRIMSKSHAHHQTMTKISIRF